MLAPEYGRYHKTLHGVDELNIAKKRINERIQSNVEKRYEMKKNLEGVNDMSTLKSDDRLTPANLKNYNDTTQLFNNFDFAYKKMMYYANNFSSLFEYKGNPYELQITSNNDFARASSNYNQFLIFQKEAKEILSKLEINADYLGKSEKKKIDKLFEDITDYSTNFEEKFFDGNDVAQITRAGAQAQFAGAQESVNKLNEFAKNIYNGMIELYNTLKAITVKKFESGLNPFLKGKGVLVGGGKWNPQLFPDIPSKYQ
jgi:hypothetical protein